MVSPLSFLTSSQVDVCSSYLLLCNPLSNKSSLNKVVGNNLLFCLTGLWAGNQTEVGLAILQLRVPSPGVTWHCSAGIGPVWGPLQPFWHTLLIPASLGQPDPRGLRPFTGRVRAVWHLLPGSQSPLSFSACSGPCLVVLGLCWSVGVPDFRVETIPGLDLRGAC